jgi:hypothetical protein
MKKRIRWAAPALAALLLGCAEGGSLRQTPPEAWRLVPEATVLGERREFFIYGKGLAKAEVTAPQGTTVEKGWLNPDGRALAVYLKVEPITDDSTALGEKPGQRRIVVKTPDTTVTLPLKVLNEVPR